MCLYGAVYQCFDSSEYELLTLLCAAELHKCDVARTGAPVAVAEFVWATETIMNANGRKEMTLNNANREAKKEKRLRQGSG